MRVVAFLAAFLLLFPYTQFGIKFFPSSSGEEIKPQPGSNTTAIRVPPFNLTLFFTGLVAILSAYVIGMIYILRCIRRK